MAGKDGRGTSYYRALAGLLPPGSSLLDLACGDGALLREAQRAGARRAVGVELSEAGVLGCVAAGLSVYQGDITEGLADYPDGSFDCVSLIRTVELLARPEPVLDEMLRVGRAVLLTFTNHGQWWFRGQCLFAGRVPGTSNGDLSGPPTRLSLSLLRRYCKRTEVRVRRTLPFPAGLLTRSLPGLFAQELAVLLQPRSQSLARNNGKKVL